LASSPADRPIWPIGTRIRTLRGEAAADTDEVLRTVPPESIGVITQVLHTTDGQPYYAVAFGDGDTVSIFLDPDELADPTAYTVTATPAIDAAVDPPRPADLVWIAWCLRDGELAAARNGAWVHRLARVHVQKTGHRVRIGYPVSPHE
jgi:hypothetical protein